MGLKIKSDIGGLVLGRQILCRQPTSSIEFVVMSGESYTDHLPVLFQHAAQTTRFGRIGIFLGRGGAFSEFLDPIKKQLESIYQDTQKNNKKRKYRSETLDLQTYGLPLLTHMAQEGYADTVEFRRLARKFLRPLRHAHRDTVVFGDLIFGEEKTQKILQHIAGSQLRVITITDVFDTYGVDLLSQAAAPKQNIILRINDDPVWMHGRAEKILRTKLAAGAVGGV